MLFDPTVARSAINVLLHGLAVTVEITIASGFISLVAGIPVALMRMSHVRAVRLAVSAYVQFTRATPLLVQLIYIYFALPLVGISFSPFVAGTVGLSFHLTPYLGEVYRSGILTVPRGQRDAAQALGMRPTIVFSRIILPQAFRAVIPVLGNYMVSLFKDSSLVSVVTVQELLFSGELVAARTYAYFTIYTMVLIAYFIVGYPSIKLVEFVEHRMARGYAQRDRSRR